MGAPWPPPGALLAHMKVTGWEPVTFLAPRIPGLEPESAACLERATLFVGNDSGLMHMAAAGGTPTLGLFGPSRDEIYAPWGDDGVAVRTPESFTELTTAPDYDHRTTDTLMRSLTVDAVADAATSLVGRESLVAS